MIRCRRVSCHYMMCTIISQVVAEEWRNNYIVHVNVWNPSRGGCSLMEFGKSAIEARGDTGEHLLCSSN